jgi:hypothetical protein
MVHLKVKTLSIWASSRLNLFRSNIAEKALPISHGIEPGPMSVFPVVNSTIFLNKPTGTSPEKVESHYYCVMVARLTIDYFLSLFCNPQWRSPEDWECVLSTIRTSIFSNQNCELTINDSGDFLITYLDGDRQGIKKRLAQLLNQRKINGLNKVSWWWWGEVFK